MLQAMQEHAPIYTVYWSGRKYLAHMTRVRVRARVWVARALIKLTVGDFQLTVGVFQLASIALVSRYWSDFMECYSLHFSHGWKEI